MSGARGLGFFAKLLDSKPDNQIELSGEGLRQTYVVRSNRGRQGRAVGALRVSTDRWLVDWC